MISILVRAEQDGKFTTTENDKKRTSSIKEHRQAAWQSIRKNERRMEVDLRVSFAETVQAVKIAFDQRFLLSTAPALELSLSLQSLAFRVICLSIDETNGAMLESVRSASTVVVSLHTSVKVFC